MMHKISLLAGSIGFGILMILDCPRVGAKSLPEIADLKMPIATLIADVPKDNAYFERLKQQQ